MWSRQSGRFFSELATKVFNASVPMSELITVRGSNGRSALRQTQVSCSNKHTYPNTQHPYPGNGSLDVGRGQESEGKKGTATPAKSYTGVYPPLSGRFSQPERVFLLVIKLGSCYWDWVKEWNCLLPLLRNFSKKNQYFVSLQST
jgi:hypothetical protein